MPRRTPSVVLALAFVLCATAALAAPLGGPASAAVPSRTAVPAPGPTTSAFDGASPTGPDVSNWQHTNGVAIDWRAVRDSGQQFALVKATQGTDSVNPWFRRDFDGAASVGLFRGAYAFAQPQLPISTAADQARGYAAAVRSLQGPLDLPPALDLEVDGGLSPTDLISWTRTWLTTAEQLTGRRPMIYSGPWFWSSAMGGTTAFRGYYLWQAQWTPPLSPMGGWPAATFWQYTSTGSIPGIGGNVDISRFNGSRDQLTQLARTVTGPDIGADGTFIVSAQKHAVYRMAGGAPIYVSTWDPFPGQTPVEVDQSYIDSLPTTPADGTILVGSQRGEVYIVAGGAPIYTSTIAPIPAGKTWTWVDSNAIDSAGGSGVWSHLRAVPADGTVVVGQQRGEIYIVAGGAPIYTSTLAPVGTKSWTVIDVTAIDAAGQGRKWNHLANLPADGTVLVGKQRGEVYIVAGGAPIYTSTTAPIPAGVPWTDVDSNAIDKAGLGLVNHLLARPMDGTVLIGHQRGEVYIVAGGAPIYTSTTAPIPRSAHWTDVDVTALDRAGSGRQWNHLVMVPVPGTVLKTAPTAGTYVVNGVGQARPQSAPLAGTPSVTVIDSAAVRNAGGPSPWWHLAA
ncbi:MAG: glycoside hydrolase family 25 protein [Acidimicrobiales bacterium]